MRRRLRRPDLERRGHASGRNAGSDGAVDARIVDSGVERGHPLVGPVESAVTVTRDGDAVRSRTTSPATSAGHGDCSRGSSARWAPGCRLHSVRVLGAGATGVADLILAACAGADRGALSRDQPQPVHDEAPLRGRAARARRPRILQPHGDRRPPTTCRPTATRGASPRSCWSAAMSRPTCSSGTRTRRRPSSSSVRRRRRGRLGGATCPAARQQLRRAAHRRVAALALAKHPELTRTS